MLVFGGASSFALGVLEHLIGNVVGITLNFSEGGYRLDPGLALILGNLANGVFLGAMIAAAAAALAAGLLIRRTRVLPGWLLWLAVAVTVLALPTIPPLSFIAAVLLVVWVCGDQRGDDPAQRAGAPLGPAAGALAAFVVTSRRAAASSRGCRQGRDGGPDGRLSCPRKLAEENR